MKCKRCKTTIIGKFCHTCGTNNPQFTRLEPLCFEELAAIFYSVPDASIIVEQCGVDKIAAIKLYRDVSGLGLREAKDAIDIAYDEKYPQVDDFLTWYNNKHCNKGEMV